jgi:hypothetical protein
VSRSTLLAAAVAALTLAAPATASAVDACLGTGDFCPAGAPTFSDLDSAADWINANPAAGVAQLHVGPGEWPGGGIFMRATEIIGSGVGSTTLVQAAGGGSVVILGTSTSKVRDLAIRMTGTVTSAYGIKTDGGTTSVERVRITAPTAATGMAGIRVGNGLSLTDVTVDFAGAGYGVMLERGTLNVSGARIIAQTGIDTAGGNAGDAVNVVRSRIDANRGIDLRSGTAQVAATALRLAGADPIGVRATAGSGTLTARLRGVTIAGPPGGGTGIDMSPVASAAAALDASDVAFAGGLGKAVRSSPSATNITGGTITDFAVPDHLKTVGGADAWLELVNGAAGPGVTNRRWIGTGALTADLGPQRDGGLVDMGGTAALPDWAGTTDLLGTARAFDGDGDGAAVRDIGAIEYVPAPPAPADPVPSPPPAAPAPPAPQPAPALPAPAPRVASATAKLGFGKLGTLRLARKQRVSVPVRCDRACTATLLVRTPGRKGVTLGSASVKLAKAGTKTVVVTIGRKGLGKLPRGRTTAVSLVLRAPGSAEVAKATKVVRPA